MTDDARVVRDALAGDLDDELFDNALVSTPAWMQPPRTATFTVELEDGERFLITVRRFPKRTGIRN